MFGVKIYGMKTIAVICEFNPFHKGHGYFLDEVRKVSKADYIIAVMSGDFVQRGEPALFNKYIRTEAALKNGCDLVLELPVKYSCSSAGGFAIGAVSLISSLKVADEIWFGSEVGNISKIKEIAKILYSESDTFKENVKSCLKQGLSYPSAISAALKKEKSCKDLTSVTTGNLLDIISSPNNTLGVQYCIAALKLSFDLSKMHTIKRVGSPYESSVFSGEYSSAFAIRNQYKKDGLTSVKSAVPANCLDIFSDIKGGIYTNDFSSILKYKILTSDISDLSGYADISSDLARRIKNAENDFISFDDFITKIKSKNYTYTHISRAFISILLGLKNIDAIPFHPYKQVRILGMCSCSPLLQAIDKAGGASLISQPYDIKDPNYDGTIAASDLYESIYGIKYKLSAIKEGTQKLIKL